MSDFSFEYKELPHEGSLMAQQRNQAAMLHAVRCFEEAFSVGTIEELPNSKRELGRVVCQSAYEHALENYDLTDRILLEQEAFEDKLLEEG